MIHKGKKPVSSISSKFKTSAFQRNCWKNEIDKPGWEKNLQNTYLVRNIYLGYIKNSQKLIIRKEPTTKMGKRF